MKANTVDDFFRLVDRRGLEECWLWKGRTNNAGEGVFLAHNAATTAHRFAWTIANGNPPRRQQIIRTCRQRLCVNPRHLAVAGSVEALFKNFLRRISIESNGCWIWTAAKNKHGYGLCGKELAHRVSWVLHRGPISKGLNVLHHCDNPPCVNPDHLFLGTQHDNIMDMLRKGRENFTGGGPKAGVKHFTEDQIRLIRKLYEPGVITQKTIGIMFSVIPSVISRIVNREWYKSVD